MVSKWIFGILSCIALIDCVPIEYVYTGDGCECPTRLGYQVNVPKLPKPPKVVPYDHGYKIDVPPMQAKAKVSYTFDFSVEEPRPPPRPSKQSQLDLYAKVDRISMNKADCPDAYAAQPPPPPPLSAPCKCGQCGSSRPTYRYVNGKWISSKCKCPKCTCHLRRRKPNTISATGTPIVVASGTWARSKNSIRRKRDLSSLFFRPRRQNSARQARYVKLYHKGLSKEKQGWLDLDLFSEANPFKRKTKKVFFPHTGARIVKRDIKGEYDLLEKEREAADLTLPEIIQFMPETLQPGFKRGPCQFGCSKSCTHAKEAASNSAADEEEEGIEKEYNPNKATTATTTPTVDIEDDNAETIDTVNNENDEKNNIDNEMTMTTPSFTKRNAALYGYQLPDVPSILPPNAYMPQQSFYAAEIGAPPPPPQIPHNPHYDSAPASASPSSPCEQRQLYAAMRRAELATKYGDDSLGPKYPAADEAQLRLLMPSTSAVPDPFTIGGAPLHYAGDLDVPHVAGYSIHSEVNPMVGAPQYPVQHISSAVLDRIITDIVYRHPEFIDASSHYGGALVDPEPYQEQQTKAFIKKLIDGRLSLLFGEPEDQFLHYYPTQQSYRGHSYNPYVQPPRTYTYYHPAMY